MQQAGSGEEVSDMENQVREFLKKHGAAQHVIDGGLAGLMEKWERVVEEVKRGYSMGLDDYLNDMDGRQILEEALAHTTDAGKEPYMERLRTADSAVKPLLTPTSRCLWGESVAAEEGWTPEKNWWYFSKPLKADGDLLDEIDGF
jgi:hypothetical protein